MYWIGKKVWENFVGFFIFGPEKRSSIRMVNDDDDGYIYCVCKCVFSLASPSHPPSLICIETVNGCA